LEFTSGGPVVSSAADVAETSLLKLAHGMIMDSDLLHDIRHGLITGAKHADGHYCPCRAINQAPLLFEDVRLLYHYTKKYLRRVREAR
jgi:ferredoxin-thioredoxin reductase catalytic subunit